MPGVLLPSASVLKNFIAKPMHWRIRVDHPPRRHLDYYFLRSSFNPEDHENLHNFEEHTVHSPPNCPFDASLQVGLLVAEDGTARPRFIYKSGRTEDEETAVNGKPFYLDMTYSQNTSTSKAFIGLDFGTSNTSISFVNSASVQVYQRRSVEKSWRELSDLVSSLPYPIAVPLAHYIGQSNPTMLVRSALEFFEAALALASYIAFLEYCVHKSDAQTKIFKGYTERSAGPLWSLLKACLRQLGNNSTISSPYKELLTPEFCRPIDEAVNAFARYKHNKAGEASINTIRPIQILANVSQKVFGNYILGFFERVQKQRFGKDYEGIFRHTVGCPPFIRVSKYHRTLAFSGDDPILLNIENCMVLSLQPLMFWDHCPNHTEIDTGHCFIYDIDEKKMINLFLRQ
jgi:hypothetical protein